MKNVCLYLLLGASVLIGACGSDDADTEAAVRTLPDAPKAERDSADVESSEPVIMFLGNSITAGYGIDPEDAFPQLIQERIDSLGWNFRVVNAGLSGETSAGGLRRVQWLLDQPVSVLVIELGGNDGLRGISPDVTRRNLAEIIEIARDRNPGVAILLAGMQIPPNLGHEYTRRFREIYPSLAQEQGVALIPFLMENVGGIASLMQRDGIHPTESGHRIMAENVWEVLGPLLREMRTEELAAS